jgi:hypothetical protein
MRREVGGVIEERLLASHPTDLSICIRPGKQQFSDFELVDLLGDAEICPVIWRMGM